MVLRSSLHEVGAVPDQGHGGIAIPAALLDRIRRLAAVGSGYPNIYRAIAVALRSVPDADPDTRRWYAMAAEVNDPAATSFIHYFARSYLVIEAYRQTAVRMAPNGATVQRCSDDIAATILAPVLSGARDAVLAFPALGPGETRRITRRLLPGLLLDRTIWPAYGQLAWHHAGHGLRARICRWLPFWQGGLPRWLCPAELFADDAFLGELSDEERAHVLDSAGRAARHARRCVRARRWVDAELFGPTPA